MSRGSLDPVWPALLFGFFVGSIPFGVIVGRLFFKTDIRAAGSGNIGAANALRTLGKKAGAAILVLDALKGTVAVFVAARLAASAASTAAPAYGNEHVLALVPLAALAAVVGHCFTPWLRFRGGKGVATYLGAVSALSWPAAIVFALVWLTVVARSQYASLASLIATIVAGAAFVAFGSALYGSGALAFALGAATVVFWQHRSNIARLRAGSENRTPLFKR